MEPDEHLTPEPASDAPALPERRCILTGAHGPRAALIRLAVGPDQQVAADLAAKLPGRGAWVVADRPLLEAAMTGKGGGKLRGALARAFKSNSLKVPDDLPAQISAGMQRRALDRLGLENKSGNLIWGHERIGEALIKGRVRLLLHAADAAADGMGKLEARRRGASPNTPSLILPVGREILSMALGRENVVHAAIADAASAVRVIEALQRWAAYEGRAARHGNEDEDTGFADTAVAVAADGRH